MQRRDCDYQYTNLSITVPCVAIHSPKFRTVESKIKLWRSDSALSLAFNRYLYCSFSIYLAAFESRLHNVYKLGTHMYVVVYCTFRRENVKRSEIWKESTSSYLKRPVFMEALVYTRGVPRPKIS